VSDYYILDDEHNLITTDVRTWGDWFQNNDNRIVAKTSIGDIVISTVCLGLDHNWGDGPLMVLAAGNEDSDPTNNAAKHHKPHLFETMIFGGERDQECWRCATWAEAEAQHERVVAEVTNEPD
jgi:hypothetical protein